MQENDPSINIVIYVSIAFFDFRLYFFFRLQTREKSRDGSKQDLVKSEIPQRFFFPKN